MEISSPLSQHCYDSPLKIVFCCYNLLVFNCWFGCLGTPIVYALSIKVSQQFQCMNKNNFSPNWFYFDLKNSKLLSRCPKICFFSRQKWSSWWGICFKVTKFSFYVKLACWYFDFISFHLCSRAHFEFWKQSNQKLCFVLNSNVRLWGSTGLTP